MRTSFINKEGLAIKETRPTQRNMRGQRVSHEDTQRLNQFTTNQLRKELNRRGLEIYPKHLPFENRPEKDSEE